MTSYLVYADQPTCLARTHAEAIARGAGGPSDVTQYWWARVAHPTSGQWSLAVPDADVASLTAPERAALISATVMQASGWFPPETF